LYVLYPYCVSIHYLGLSVGSLCSYTAVVMQDAAIEVDSCLAHLSPEPLSNTPHRQTDQQQTDQYVTSRQKQKLFNIYTPQGFIVSDWLYVLSVLTAETCSLLHAWNDPV